MEELQGREGKSLIVPDAGGGCKVKVTRILLCSF